MCICESGCDSKRCGCFKNDRGCSDNCNCKHCKNPLGKRQLQGSSDTAALDISLLQKKVDRINRNVETVMKVAESIKPVKQAQLDNAPPMPSSSVSSSQPGISYSGSQPSYQQSQHQVVTYQQQALSPSHVQPQIGSPVNLAEPQLYSSIFSLVSTGGVTSFFQDLEAKGFRFVQGDSNSRHYSFNYPGTTTSVLEIRVVGLPDMRVSVKVISCNNEIFQDFVANFLRRYS